MDTLRGSRCTMDVDDVVVACENRQVTIDMYRSACCCLVRMEPSNALRPGTPRNTNYKGYVRESGAPAA